MGEPIALFTASPLEVPTEWTVVRSRWIDQMVCERSLEPTAAVTVELGEHDVRAMLALTAATEPGPFGRETIRMGRYRGIKSAFGELLSMAGERLRLRGFTEVSGVCTMAQARGNGYARALVLAIAGTILNEGVTPFLHVKTENGAKRLYEQIGFRVRRQIWLTVMTRT
jgi:predicted GNAT family acetyltransferase